jgi:predicted dehydrogenase
VNKIRLGIVGAGHLGKIHAKLAHELDEFDVVAVADPSEASLRELAAEIPVTTVDEHCELIGKIDAAIIAVPSTLHHQVATELLDAGVHLFVEKPIAVSVGEADEMVSIADERGVILQVGHVERFNPAFTAATPHIVEPVFIEANRTFLHSLRSMDIGVVHDLMIHDIDLALSLADAPLQRVDAIGGTVIGPREDMAQSWLTFANGMVANLKASRVSTTSRRTMTVYCRERVVAIDFSTCRFDITELSTTLDGTGLNVEDLDANSRRELQQSLVADAVRTRTIVVPTGNAIRAELQEFANCIHTGSTPKVCGRAGRNAVDVAELVCLSVRKFHQQHQLPAPRTNDLRTWRKAA